MARVVELLRSRRVPQVAALALVSFAFAGCSADTSSRFSASNFSTPLAAPPEATASVPTAAVERRELPQYSRPHTAPPQVAAPQSYPAAPGPGMSGGGRGLSSYAPPKQPQLETTGSVGPKSVAATRNAPAHSGTSIIVGTSDTLEIIAKRYNVSTSAILQANGYKGPRALSPGQQLIIPRPTTTAAAPAQQVAALSPPATRSVTPAAPEQSARWAQSNVQVEEMPAEPAAAAKPSETTSALPSFRWPVRGKVITGYGAKTNGKSNDGINVAVPEGTPVKAAEDGVVAYSGNELKGYGNLILVRHS